MFRQGFLARLALASAALVAVVPVEQRASALEAAEVAVAPTRVDTQTGGIAARVFGSDGHPVPGRLYLLMAVPGSDMNAEVWDHAPYPQRDGGPHPEAAGSLRAGADVAGALTDLSVPYEEFISSPGGGDSGGLIYVLAHLNRVSGGRLTDGLSVAATGGLEENGYVGIVRGIDAKVGAAELAHSDVVFVPSLTPAIRARTDVRVVGEMTRARHTGAPLAEERRWERYDEWGATAPVDRLDVVGVRHVGDALAYLCGRGSSEACGLLPAADLRSEDGRVAVPGVRRCGADGHGPFAGGRAAAPEADVCDRVSHLRGPAVGTAR